jgi:DNA-directed RNA polymerase specialized sigma24 family protein
MSDVTTLLNLIDRGDPAAPDRLWSLVYAELKRMAAGISADDPAARSLDATALVHEAYLRLVVAARRRRCCKSAGKGDAAQVIRCYIRII